MTLTIVLPWPPKALSPNAREHWATKAAAVKRYKSDAWIAAHEVPYVTLNEFRDAHHAHANVRFTFHPPSAHRHDVDNCLASIKAGIDSIAYVIQLDDSRWRMTPILAEPVPGGKVVVEIEAAA